MSGVSAQRRIIMEVWLDDVDRIEAVAVIKANVDAMPGSVVTEVLRAGLRRYIDSEPLSGRDERR